MEKLRAIVKSGRNKDMYVPFCIREKLKNCQYF